MPDTHELAWAAGFFDGEGSIFTVWQVRKSGKRHPYVRLSIANTFLPSLHRFQDAVGGIGNIYDVGTSKPGYKNRFVFSTNRWESISDIITLLWPWLGEEKKNAAFEAFHNKLTEEALEELLSTLNERM